MGLKKYDALLQVPIFYCNWSLFDIIGGGIYFDEFSNFDVKSYAGFVSGVCLIFFGVLLLSKRLSKLTRQPEIGRRDRESLATAHRSGATAG